MGKYCCEWCGNTHQECECEDRTPGMSYEGRALKTILDVLQLRDERQLPRIETVRLAGAL